LCMHVPVPPSAFQKMWLKSLAIVGHHVSFLHFPQPIIPTWQINELVTWE